MNNFKDTLQELCGGENQEAFFINSAKVCKKSKELTQEQMRDARDLLLALTKRAISANQGRMDTYRGKVSWGENRRSSCAVM